jgi:hypothetical protein
MPINIVRLFQIIFFVCIVVSKKYYLLYYCGVMYISLEFLNSREKYRNQPQYRFYNILFIGFQVLFCLDRLRTSTFKLPNWAEWQMNSLEHLLFAFIISFKITQYINLSFLGKFSLIKRLIMTFLLFNMIGFWGEVFQNSLTENTTVVLWTGSFQFLSDNTKDMQMNFVGSILFVLYMIYESRKV